MTPNRRTYCMGRIVLLALIPPTWSCVNSPHNVPDSELTHSRRDTIAGIASRQNRNRRSGDVLHTLRQGRTEGRQVLLSLRKSCPRGGWRGGRQTEGNAPRYLLVLPRGNA